MEVDPRTSGPSVVCVREYYAAHPWHTRVRFTSWDPRTRLINCRLCRGRPFRPMKRATPLVIPLAAGIGAALLIRILLHQLWPTRTLSNLDILLDGVSFGIGLVMLNCIHDVLRRRGDG